MFEGVPEPIRRLCDRVSREACERDRPSVWIGAVLFFGKYIVVGGTELWKPNQTISKPRGYEPMQFRKSPVSVALTSALFLMFCLVSVVFGPIDARAQSVDDGSDAAIGSENARAILGLVERHLKSPDAKISSLRRGEGGVICGSVDVKNRMGLYTGPRGFVADLSDTFFGRVPDGPELLSPARMEDYQAMERTRQLYFKACLN